MFPWQIKRILVIVYTLRDIVFLSITHFLGQVENYLLMGAGCDLFCQLQLSPPKLLDSMNVPRFFLERQLCFQYDNVLRPADGHGFCHQLWDIPIGEVEIPHPPHTSGREPSGVGVCDLQIFRRGYSRTLFWPAADQTADAAVQLHLRQVCRH